MEYRRIAKDTEGSVSTDSRSSSVPTLKEKISRAFEWSRLPALLCRAPVAPERLNTGHVRP
jgi:hypothetical protein